MTGRHVEIGGRRIGDGVRPLVIAEIGVNHDGDVERAERLIDAAADAGADAAKLQTFRADRLALPEAAQAEYQRERASAASQLDMLRSLELPSEALAGLRDRALDRGLLFLSSPFDVESAELLIELGVPAIKIGSGDLTNLFLLRAVADRRIPVLLSTGMATLEEVDRAVEDLRSHGDPALVLLQCVSTYPATPEMIDLRAMRTMAERYGVPVGYSDHTMGIGAAVAATALGAAVIEKHLTLDRTLPGPDHAASLEPIDFRAMVDAIREAHDALGSGEKAPRPEEDDVRAVARRSIVIARRVPTGELLTSDDLTALRPESGLSPLLLDSVLGRAAARDLLPGRLLRPDDLDPPLSPSADRRGQG
jgi:N-acetylneuraminate synthase/N,N'-diacetyllegionaminate synthase